MRAGAPNTALVFLSSITAQGIEQVGSNVWKDSRGILPKIQAPSRGIPSAMGLMQMDRPDTAWESWPLHFTCSHPSRAKNKKMALHRWNSRRKLYMGVRKWQSPKHTKNAMAKHLLELIKWQVSIIYIPPKYWITADRSCMICCTCGKSHISFSLVEVHDLLFPHQGALWILTGPDYRAGWQD